MTRAVLSLLLCAMTLAVGLYTSGVQHENFVRAAELDEQQSALSVIEAEIQQKWALAQGREAALLEPRTPSEDASEGQHEAVPPEDPEDSAQGSARGVDQ